MFRKYRGKGERRVKNIEVRMKFVSLQCSWVKILYADCFHDLKIILLHLIAKYFDSHFKFHSNLHKDNVLKILPAFYKQMLIN